jgi:WD40 repeat protein
MAEMRELLAVPNAEVAAYKLAFSPDGELLAWSSAQDQEAHVVLWEVGAGRFRHDLGRPGEVRDLAFASDGRLLAAALGDGSALVWDVSTGALRERHQCGLSQADGVAFAPDGRTLAVGGAGDGARVVLWDVENAGRPSEKEGVLISVMCVGLTWPTIPHHSVPQPTWEQIEAVVRQMDGHGRCEVIIKANERKCLMLGGGGGRPLCVPGGSPTRFLRSARPSNAGRRGGSHQHRAAVFLRSPARREFREGTPGDKILRDKARPGPFTHVV